MQFNLILHVICMSIECHSYVLVCHRYVTRMYSYVIRMPLVCTGMSTICQLYVLVLHPYVTRQWFYHEPLKTPYNSLTTLCKKFLVWIFMNIIQASLKFQLISTSNHMFKKETWDKFTEFTFFKFQDVPSKTREISKSQKMSEVNLPQISQINM